MFNYEKIQMKNIIINLMQRKYIEVSARDSGNKFGN